MSHDTETERAAMQNTVQRYLYLFSQRRWEEWIDLWADDGESLRWKAFDQLAQFGLRKYRCHRRHGFTSLVRRAGGEDERPNRQRRCM